MDIAFLFPIIVLVGVMYLMSRSARNRQRQAAQMRDAMEPGTGVRTIGGMYALVKEVREDTVLLEIAPGLHAVYAKSAVGAILDAEEYERIVNGESPFEDESVQVPDDASSLIEAEEAGDAAGDRVELGKSENADAAAGGDAAESEQDAETEVSGNDNDGEHGTKS
ncbi:preprotein translocase subunit YajC [Streptomyces hoynatensis]|uniref:preprotein translocase subunit YajC n=1 Tax=Streptomyces hoynatensis TaxID=1141874 RepID=UPI001F4EE10F|nr:preprotein translocase subunit YajC [Streptomyces hoynatensis]